MERGENERQRNINRLPLAQPQPEIWLATQAYALTGNRTSDLLVCRAVLNPLSHTNQGSLFILNELGFRITGLANFLLRVAAEESWIY